MCLFVVCTTQLVGSQFWDQGLNWGHSSEITEKRKSRIGRLTDIFFFCHAAEHGRSQSQTRDWTLTPCSGSSESLTTRPPRKSHGVLFYMHLIKIIDLTLDSKFPKVKGHICFSTVSPQLGGCWNTVIFNKYSSIKGIIESRSYSWSQMQSLVHNERLVNISELDWIRASFQ